MLSPYTIYTLSIHCLYTVYAWAAEFYDKDINYLRGERGGVGGEGE